MNNDQVKGRVEEVKGKVKVKEVTGKVIGNKDLEVEGTVQKNVGKGQAAYGDVKKNVADEIDKS